MEDNRQAEYVLEMTEKQAEVISAALEIYARIGIGQLSEVLEHPDVTRALIASRADRGELEKLMAELKASLFGLKENASFSIMSERVNDRNRVAWDIRNVIRHRLSWDRAWGEDGHDFKTLSGVQYDQPTRTAHSEELPQIKLRPGTAPEREPAIGHDATMKPSR